MEGAWGREKEGGGFTRGDIAIGNALGWTQLVRSCTCSSATARRALTINTVTVVRVQQYCKIQSACPPPALRGCEGIWPCHYGHA